MPESNRCSVDLMSLARMSSQDLSGKVDARTVGLQESRPNIDRQREDGCVEEKSDHAMQRRNSSHVSRGHVDVGCCAGSADDIRIINEVPVIWWLVPWKLEPFRQIVTGAGEVFMCVMYCEYCMCKRP